jgi:hypothetical protein
LYAPGSFLLREFTWEDKKTIMIQTGSPVISIYTEMTPNPETMKFVANKLLYPGKSIDFPDIESATLPDGCRVVQLPL